MVALTVHPPLTIRSAVCPVRTPEPTNGVRAAMWILRVPEGEGEESLPWSTRLLLYGAESSAAVAGEPGPALPPSGASAVRGPAAPLPAPERTLDARPQTRIAPPVALRVPAIEVDAAVVVGREADGAMEIPSDVRTVGWFEPFPGAGVIPGEQGTAVIAGHVDSRTQGRGASWPLRELTAGDVIEVVHGDGTATRWRIDDVIRYPKADIPIDDSSTFDGVERLVPITCGGEFDRSLGAYLDDYIVMASPLPAATGGVMGGDGSVPGRTLPSGRDASCATLRRGCRLSA
jgi:hypothetical protein